MNTLPVIRAKFNKGNWYCREFGLVDGWHPTLHLAHKRWGSNGRLCVHRTRPMGRTTLFGWQWVNQLTWRATVTEGKHPVIANRQADVVRIMVDVIGPVRTGGCRYHADYSTPQHKWSYKLHRIQFEDEEQPDERIVLGALIC